MPLERVFVTSARCEWRGLKKTAIEPLQPTVSFELIHRPKTSAIFKSSNATCLRGLAGKYGKRLTEDYAVI